MIILIKLTWKLLRAYHNLDYMIYIQKCGIYASWSIVDWVGSSLTISIWHTYTILTIAVVSITSISLYILQWFSIDSTVPSINPSWHVGSASIYRADHEPKVPIALNTITITVRTLAKNSNSEYIYMSHALIVIDQYQYRYPSYHISIDILASLRCIYVV